MSLTHTELNQRAIKWLLSNGCSVAISEIKCWNNSGEIVDALGFRSDCSILIESKASRADFLADRHKRFRITPELGVGQLRYYLCEKDIIRPEDLPDKWGLLYIAGSTIRKIVTPPYQEKEFYHTHNHLSERSILISACRRLGVFEQGILGKVFFKEKPADIKLLSQPPKD